VPLTKGFSKIKRVINKLRQLSARYFPERQMYFRTNGVVQFVTLSERTQVISVTAIFFVVCWLVISSLHFVFKNQIMAAKDQEVEKINQEYVELNNQFNTLKDDIENTARLLEQRQVYLNHLIETEKNLDGQLPENTDAAGQTPAVAPKEAKNKPQASLLKSFMPDENNQDLNEVLKKVRFDLKRIEYRQQKMAETMISRLSNKLAYIDDTLKDSGVKSDVLAKFASKNLAQGGPLITYEASEQDENILKNESFATLFESYNRLVTIETAIQSMPIIKPVEKYYISSKFGMRRDPFKRTWAKHNGLDMAGWHKTPVHATSNGKVIRAGWNGPYGKFIDIDHGNGFRSRYGHLSKILVKKGDEVSIEQKIGLMGSTGRSSGTHLHYEIWFNGKPINPLTVFKAADNVLKIKRQSYSAS